MAPTEEKNEPTDEEDGWPIKEPREVLADRKLRYPPDVQEVISAEHPEGPSVYWNYDTYSEFVFISESPATGDGYEYIARNTVEDPDGQYTKIRAPQALPTRIRQKFELKGTYMVYLATEEMIEDENPSAWILAWSQFTSLLPNQAGHGDDDPDRDDVSRLITNNPGFFSPDSF
jgi:hypothetical protein